MNCPGHVMIFSNDVRSYRDLPMRMFEFGTVYRHELSGVVHGLMRARGFTQDDAHIFCTPEQVHDEVIGMLDLVDYVIGVFGFEYSAEVSTRPEKSIGEDADWEIATNALIETLEGAGHRLRDQRGRRRLLRPQDRHQAQGRHRPHVAVLDHPGRLQLPRALRPDVPHRREHRGVPFMLHRTILGSMERFFGILIEHYAGAFPTWLAPVQAVLIPIADRHIEHTEAVAKRLRKRACAPRSTRTTSRCASRSPRRSSRRCPTCS